MTGKTSLTGVDDLDKATAVKLLAAVHSPNMQEYQVTTSPFKTPMNCTVNGLNVNAKFNELDKVYKGTAAKEAKKLDKGATDIDKKGIFGSAMEMAKKALAFTPLGMGIWAGSKIADGVKAVGGWVADKATAAYEGAKSGLSWMGDKISSGLNTAGSAISGGWNSLISGLKSAGSAVSNSLSNAFTTPSGRAGLVDSVGVIS